MLTLTSKHAIRALIYLAQNAKDQPIPGRQVAEPTGIPRKYLSKILGDLTRIGLLRSSPGRTGGFELAQSADKTRLLDVLRPFEQFEREECPFHNQACGRKEPCMAHANWAKILTAKRRFLECTTLQDVATKPPKPRRKRSSRRR